MTRLETPAPHGDELHLDEVALEALATGRDELATPAQLDHLDECAQCAEAVALERLAADDASLALRRAAPPLEDLDFMIARAMAKAPADPRLVAGGIALEGDAPSRRSLVWGAGVGGALAVALGIFALPTGESLGSWGALGRQVLTLGRALDRVVEASFPGGWLGVAVGGLLAALALALPTRALLRGGRAQTSLATGALALALALGGALGAPGLAHAYRLDGEWPTPQPTVDVDVDQQPISEALRQAADSAGLGVMVRLEDDAPVTLHAHGVPIGDVVEALLAEHDVVVRPGASMLTIRPDDLAASAVAPSDEPAPSPPDPSPVGAAPAPPPTPSAPPPPPTTRERGAALGDLVTLGDDAEVGPTRSVRGVYTMGGDVLLLGHAYGDVVTMGGNATIAGEVVGNVTTMGGDIHVQDGAEVHGDLNAMGGEVEIADGSRVYGRVMGDGDEAAGQNVQLSIGRETSIDSQASSGAVRWALWNALLFLFGLLMLGSARKRFSNLRAEISLRPVRATLGGFFGLLGGLALGVALSLTFIGIPAAMVLGLLLASGWVFGWGAAAWWLGAALPIPQLAERPVLQLGVGIGVLFLVGLVPKIGPVIVFASACTGLGAVLATGFGNTPREKKKRTHTPTGPFRTDAR